MRKIITKGTTLFLLLLIILSMTISVNAKENWTIEYDKNVFIDVNVDDSMYTVTIKNLTASTIYDVSIDICVFMEDGKYKHKETTENVDSLEAFNSTKITLTDYYSKEVLDNERIVLNIKAYYKTKDQRETTTSLIVLGCMIGAVFGGYLIFSISVYWIKKKDNKISCR